MEIMGVAGVAAISVIAYLIGEVCKALPVNNKWIPAICGISGAILGGVALYTVPDFPADNMINAVAMGIVSGLAATGANQMVRQLQSE